jgi:hypothetical protein
MTSCMSYIDKSTIIDHLMTTKNHMYAYVLNLATGILTRYLTEPNKLYDYTVVFLLIKRLKIASINATFSLFVIVKFLVTDSLVTNHYLMDEIHFYFLLFRHGRKSARHRAVPVFFLSFLPMYERMKNTY